MRSSESHAQTTGAARVAIWLFVAAVASLAMILLSYETGPIPQLIFGHDLFALLDGAWKWKWGSFPHLDYYSPVGCLTYAIVALGLQLSGSLINAMPAAVALFALLLLPALLFASFTRMRPAFAAIVTIALTASVLAPHQLKYDSDALTYCIVYNRWGYGLFCLVLLIATVRPNREGPWVDMIDGLIVGVCVVLTVFLKMSYGILAVAVFASWGVIHLRGWRYYASGFIGFTTCFLAFGFVLRWRYSLFLRDMVMAFQARAKIGVDGLVDSTIYLYPDLCLLALLAVLWCLSEFLSRKGSWKQMLRASLFLACYALAAVGIVMSNAPNGTLRESPVLALGSLLLLSATLQSSRATEKTKQNPGPPFLGRTRTTGGLVAGLLAAFVVGGLLLGAELSSLRMLTVLALLWTFSDFLFPALGTRQMPFVVGLAVILTLMLVAPAAKRNILGLTYAARLKLEKRRLTPSQVIQEGELAGIQIRAFGGDPPLPTTYVGKVSDALALLDRTGNAEATVNALEFSNPLNVVRGVKPSRSGPTAWQLDIVYSRKAAPKTKRIFTAGELVMLPKQFGDGRDENLKVLRKRYGKHLAANFYPPIESEQWQLFVPRETSYEAPPTQPEKDETSR